MNKMNYSTRTHRKVRDFFPQSDSHLPDKVNTKYETEKRH